MKISLVVDEYPNIEFHKTDNSVKLSEMEGDVVISYFGEKIWRSIHLSDFIPLLNTKHFCDIEYIDNHWRYMGKNYRSSLYGSFYDIIKEIERENK